MALAAAAGGDHRGCPNSRRLRLHRARPVRSTRATLLALDGEHFVSAVSGNRRSSQAADLMIDDRGGVREERTKLAG